ncbi:hypothetical protein [Laspinema palackyanum]|uniref:hypothetical protein n=1 Tax=Laspinema palackyanum TaxID=3231601 RepID=UPI00349F5A3A
MAKKAQILYKNRVCHLYCTPGLEQPSETRRILPPQPVAIAPLQFLETTLG